MSEWQPIETAPKGHGHVLVSGPDRGRVIVGRRSKFSWECWVSVPGSYDIRPTHWMPLPEPPQEAAMSEGPATGRETP